MTDTEIIHEFAARNMLAEKYLLGELHGADLEDFEIHIFECSICANEVKAGQAFVANMPADLPADASPFSLSMAIAMAAVIIIIVGCLVCLLVWGRVQ